MNDFDQVRQLATKYFDSLYDGDADALSGIYHEHCRLHVILEGKLVEIELPSYQEIVRGRASPRSLNAERDDNILAIIKSTETTAILIVKLLLAGKSYTDHLALIKDEGRWQIISKTYHLHLA